MEQRIILDLDLTNLQAGRSVVDPHAWHSTNPGLARVGSWGGSALGVALLHGELGAIPLVLAVGSAVSRRLPTAARLSVLSRAPLTGRFAEGHIGGDLGPYLAGLADALVLRGRTDLPGAVLTLEADGGLHLEARPDLLGCSPAEVWRTLRPKGALMSIGLGGEQLLPYAVLAGGAEHPSFVGRGGLGAVFGALGLKALVIEEQREPRTISAPSNSHGLQAALSASPRLAARSAGGSMELFARADESRDAGLGGRLAREAEKSGVEQRGCRGCPTPCGWVFERADGKRQKGHFNANRALGVELGLESFDESLRLLARCDYYGLDAREVGSMLALLVRAEERLGAPALSGHMEALEGAIEHMLGVAARPLAVPSQAFALGSAALAVKLDLARERPHPQGHAAHGQLGFAGLLGQAVSCGGADPMRSFPFLVDALGRAGMDRICRDLAPLPEGAEDPDSPVAKGRLVAWHENLVAAVDAFGFCVFSTAGLLADGSSDLESIAGWILPSELLEQAPSSWTDLSLEQRLLAAGSNLVELRRSLDRRLRALPRPAGAPSEEVLTAEMRQRLELPGMLDEYLQQRLDDDQLERLKDPLAPRLFKAQPMLESVPHGARSRAWVLLQASGVLGQALGSKQELRVELELPASLPEVLQAACQSDPALERQLFMQGSSFKIPLPRAWRGERRLPEGAMVEARDTLLLISVIAGG